MCGPPRAGTVVNDRPRSTFLPAVPKKVLMMTRAGAPCGFAVLAAGLIAACFIAPDDAAEWIIAGAPLAAAAAIVGVLLVRRPVRPVPWLVLAMGLITAAVAAGVWASRFADGDAAFPALSEAILTLAYPAIFVAVLGVTSADRAANDLLVGAESLIYAIATTSLAWLAVMEPHLDGSGLPFDDSVWVWLFASFDVVLALVAVHAATRSRVGRAPMAALGAGFAVWAVGHLAVGRAQYDGDYDAGSIVAVLPVLGPLIIGVAVLLPDAMTGSPAVRRESPGLRWSRLVGLTAAALVPLLALILMLALGGGDTTRATLIVISASTLAIVLLALVRMWALVDHVRTLTERRGQDRLAAMVEHSSDVVMLADERGTVGYASPGLATTLGFAPGAWVGHHLVDVVVEEERAAAYHQLERLVGFGSGGTVEFEATLMRADGHRRRANVVMANLIGGAAVDGIVATFRDITEQRNLERQLSHRAFHDELTGLANRALFLDRMDHALRVTRPESDPVVVLFVDLDDFKAVNDALGHGVGDQLLAAIADRIRRSAGSGDTAARLGGDEFAILLEDRGGIDRAIDVAERLLDSLRAPVTIGGYDVTVLASVGIAVAAPGMSTTSLLRDADIAMYEAKRAGKGQIRIFDPAMRMVATKHLEYRSELGEALRQGELRLVYMPFVDLRTGEVRGAEALVRWHHPQHGDIPPSEFVPIAERSGLIVPIGRWVVEQGVRQAASWRPDAGLFISFNVSAVEARQPDFVDHLMETVRAHHIEPHSLMIEMTETELVEENEREAATFERLRREGFRLAIDDFGAGHCSLTYLQRHPVDLIKLDRAVVGELGQQPGNNTLARAIVHMAGSLDLRTVAEGIETTAQLRELRRLGCDLGQGYLLSRPLEAEALTRRFGSPSESLASKP
jgi:diguanylate cyclase (GGDEF)-like protein/PAS domain S-box-containing protein